MAEPDLRFYLLVWQTAHRGATRARRQRDLSLASLQTADAQAALAAAVALDPDKADPLWAQLLVNERNERVSLGDLIAFYDKQLDATRPLASRYTVTPEADKAAIDASVSQHDEARKQVSAGEVKQ